MSNFDFKKMLRENITSSQEEKTKSRLNEANTLNEAKSFVRGTATKPSSVPSQPATKEEPQPKSSEDLSQDPKTPKIKKSDRVVQVVNDMLEDKKFLSILGAYLKNPNRQASGEIVKKFQELIDTIGIPGASVWPVNDLIDIIRAFLTNRVLVNKLASERNKQNESRELAEQVIEEIIKKYENKE